MGHFHTWNPEDSRTSIDDGHSHTVTKPESGFTDGGGMNNHKHPLKETLAEVLA